MRVLGRTAIWIHDDDAVFLEDLIDEALEASQAILETTIDHDTMVESPEQLLGLVNYQEDKIRFLQNLKSQTTRRKGGTRTKD